MLALHHLLRRLEAPPPPIVGGRAARRRRRRRRRRRLLSRPVAAAAAADPTALFAQINQGGNITSGLKKVTKVRIGPVSMARRSRRRRAPAAAAAYAGGQAAEAQLDGKKWVYEFQTKAPNLSIKSR